MTFDFERIWASQRIDRQTLAAKPIAEKLRLLDAMRERALTLRRATPTVVRESPGEYRTLKKA